MICGCDNCAYLETIESPIGNIKSCGLDRVQNITEVVLVNCPRFYNKEKLNETDN